MGFFPFFAPLAPWVKTVMEDREANPQMSILQKQPFAILTSAAFVVKGGPDVFDSDKEKRAKEIMQLISGSTTSGTYTGGGYRGCILASNINDLRYTYSLSGTPVGVTFDGVQITAVGESGRKVSTPIIESIDIDTDGANNTLKTAKVKVKCFTLKQLEMFEMFYMKPGMNVLLEWGDATLQNAQSLRSKKPNEPQTLNKYKYNTLQNGEKQDLTIYDKVSDALVPKNDYVKFCKEDFYKYFKSDTAALADYVTRVEKALGSYDLVAGKVLDYSFSVEQDGTYNCELEISQGNQISLATASNKPNPKSKTKQQPKDTEYSTYNQIIEQIVSDMNLSSELFNSALTNNIPEHKGNWAADFFNFVKINKQQGDTIASDKAYVSLRFILKVLANYILSDGNCDEKFFKLETPKYYKYDKNNKKSNEQIEIIPVTSNKYMISSSEEVLFPRKDLPSVITPGGTGSKKKKKGQKNESTNQESNEEILSLTPSKDGRIWSNVGKGSVYYDFHATDGIWLPIDRGLQPNFSKNPDIVLGNALNIFVKYETVVKYWRSTYTRIDFLEKVLQLINKNSYGLFNLIYGIPGENMAPTVLDHRFAPQEVIDVNEQTSYRFKPTTINSIVKEFSFNFEMSNLVAGRTVFNSGKFLALAKQEQKNAKTIGELELPPQAYKSIDNSTFGNADGYYSINNVEFERIKLNFEKAKEQEASGSIKSEDTKTEETTNEKDNLSEIIKSKSINFLIDEGADKKNRTVVLVYNDPAIVRKKINTLESTQNRPTVTPIDVTITIDGFSGFRCGQYFLVDGIPEIYNQIGVFQIMNTKHNISKDGWTTTLEASFRSVNKNKQN